MAKDPVIPRYIVRRALVDTSISPKGKSMTQQHFKDECDINRIMKKHRDLNASPFIRPDLSLFRDVSNVPVYKEGVQVIQDAHDQFMLLPSNIRSRFDNDPLKLLEFLSDKKNGEEATRLGLLKPTVPQDSAPEPKDTSAGHVAGTPATGQPAKK